MPTNTDKLTAIRIKQQNGSYGPQIPVGADAINVKYDNLYSVKEVLGNVKTNVGPLQEQIDNIDTSSISEAVTDWLEDNPGALLPTDKTLSIADTPADAQQAGKVVTINSETDGNATKVHFNTTNQTVNVALMEDVPDLTDTIAEEYDNTKTYKVGNYVLYNNAFYRCVAAITTAEAWTAAHWTAAKVGAEITDLKTHFDITEEIHSPINLWDVSANTTGYYCTDAGAIGVNAAYFYSDFIPVEVGKTYTRQRGNLTVTQGRNIASTRYISCYDENKNILSALGATYASEFTVPNGVSYIRISDLTYFNESNHPTFVEGTTILDYSEYFTPYTTNTLKLKAECHNDDHINDLIDEKIAGDGTKVKIEDLAFAKQQNYFDKNAAGNKQNTFYWNGSESTNSAYFTTDFIEVKPNTNYAFYTRPANVSARAVVELTENKTVASTSGSNHANVSTITTRSDTKYIRCSFESGNENSAAIIEGTSVNVTPEVNEKIDSKVVDGNDIIAYLPKDIYCAVGRTIELYNNQVCLQADKYHMAWLCPVGKPMKRKFSVTGTESNVGTYNLRLSVCGDDMSVLWSGVTTLHIVSELTATAAIVPIGDSLTNSKVWLPEVCNLSGNKISYVGTYSWGLDDANGVRHNGGHEGRSGFSARNYAIGSPYTYGGATETPHNIFWDGSSFSWAQYKTASGLSPDAIQIFLGTNKIAMDNTENAGYIKQMVDAIRSNDANIPIFVCNTIYRSNQDGIGKQQGNDGYANASGAWKYSEDRKVIDLMKKLDSLLSGYANVYMINLGLCHDSEYNFGAVETAVNPRAQQTTEMPVESVHPQAQGYYQMADIMYSVYSAALE